MARCMRTICVLAPLAISLFGLVALLLVLFDKSLYYSQVGLTIAFKATAFLTSPRSNSLDAATFTLVLGFNAGLFRMPQTPVMVLVFRFTTMSVSSSYQLLVEEASPYHLKES